MPSFDTIDRFEKKISQYFGSKYGVAVDSCTHGIELCLRMDKITSTSCPNRTYLSIPMTLCKLGIDWSFNDVNWESYYYLENTRIIDAAVLWRPNSYIPGTLMCLSFQFRKHLSIGRAGMILLDDYNSYIKLKAMSYDGRDNSKSWVDQDITEMGYHYYMTPEYADHGLKKFEEVKDLEPRIWSYKDYPDLSQLTVFKNECI
jgi:dTDP-4-amino-4,6-dideoxygalactose transaminase